MMEERFSDLMVQERQRLEGEISDIDTKMSALAESRRDRERELHAVDVYEKAKTGQGRKTPAAMTSLSGRRVPRGSRRSGILQLVRNAGDGMSRGDLIRKLGVKGNRSGEMSISNALTALTKAQELVRRNGKYHVGTARSPAD